MPTPHLRRERKPQSGPRRQRIRVPRWIDPYFWIQGSEPEKMVMVELVRRGIYFEHTPQTNTLGGLVDPTWEPDFLFPQFKIWLEIQGAYFHTLPGAIEADSLRFAAIEMAGWKPVWFWEWDIRTRLREIMDAVPEFAMAQPDTSGLRRNQAEGSVGFYEGGTGIDHLKGLRQALHNRTRPPQRLKVRKRLKRRPK